MSRLLTTALLSAMLTLAAGCDDVEKAFDCIDDDRPQFSRYTLPQATVGQRYEQSIIASIRNTPDDSNFTYTFSNGGELPPGLMISTDDRTATYSGTPVEAGTFMSSLRVKIDDGDEEANGDDGDADTLCKTERTASYTIVVLEP